jgi:hypothetical protein
MDFLFDENSEDSEEGEEESMWPVRACLPYPAKPVLQKKGPVTRLLRVLAVPLDEAPDSPVRYAELLRQHDGAFPGSKTADNLRVPLSSGQVIILQRARLIPSGVQPFQEQCLGIVASE